MGSPVRLAGLRSRAELNGTGAGPGDRSFLSLKSFKKALSWGSLGKKDAKSRENHLVLVFLWLGVDLL